MIGDSLISSKTEKNDVYTFASTCIEVGIMRFSESSGERIVTIVRCLLASQNIWEGQDYVNLPAPETLRRP